MKIISNESIVLTATDQTIKKHLTNARAGDTVAAEAYITVESPTSITVKGKVDNIELDLKLMNLDTYKAVDAITEAGRYLIMTSNIDELEITASGSGSMNLKYLF